jgi:hypothetical protein
MPTSVQGVNIAYDIACSDARRRSDLNAVNTGIKNGGYVLRAFV